MTSIPDAIKATLDAQWTAAGGTEPTYYVSEDYRTDPPLGKDAIWILEPNTKIKGGNDTYEDRFHLLDLVVTTQTDDDRLKELADEVVRILNANAITGASYQKVVQRNNVSGDYTGRWVYQEKITVDIRELLATGATAYGAGATNNFIDKLLMYGSANAAWVPCFYLGYSGGVTKIQVDSSTTSLENVDGTDGDIDFECPLPTVKGSLKLYISGFRVIVNDADAAAYVNATTVYGYTHAGITSLATDATDYNSAATWTKTFAAVDCSSYSGLHVWLAILVDALDELNIQGVQLQCYYAA